jgi:hypothetical protein
MFPVKRAPHESDLEDFYSFIGSKYISKIVNKKYHVVGEAQKNTDLTKALLERIRERGLLLVSPSVTSRPLVPNAASIIDEKKLDIYQAPDLKAVYSLNQSVRSQQITCCSTPGMFGKNSLYVTSDFDWFDVGYAIGELILQRCQLEDAFFISSLLEAPLEQLRARGFPVDRIMKPESPPEPEIQPPIKSNITTESGADVDVKTSSSKADTGSTGKVADDPPPNSRKEETKDDSLPPNDCVAVLKQMFPNADETYLRDRLGETPTLDKVRALAEEMAVEGYKKDDEQPIGLEKGDRKKSKLFGSKKLGKAVSGLMGAGANAAHNLMKQQAATAPPGYAGKNKNPKTPEMEALNHHTMEKQLEQKVKQSTNVGASGFSSEDRTESIPEGLDHGHSCEVIPGHDLKPFINRTTGKAESHNGIKVFSARKYSVSEEFLNNNLDAVESFAAILERLCYIFGLKLSSIAIYHDPSAQAIAFNLNSALHFNVHYFSALHYGNDDSQTSACYSYWFVTMSHELAHNFVSPHNKDHAFYTESYCTTYLPKLMALLSNM